MNQAVIPSQGGRLRGWIHKALDLQSQHRGTRAFRLSTMAELVKLRRKGICEFSNCHPWHWTYQDIHKMQKHCFLSLKYEMIDDQDLGFFANFLGIFIFVLVIAYHYVVADPKYEGN
ncbi:hypothetical protein ZIOFF_057594 [Zingiber officinale]|uniref:Dolichyl-diphosphooligosaccharide--protein glycosyltransferase subunit 4 n=2 Tax=Mesangiospermae TaxID=1437183 RepID=A0A8J5F7T5_ZINOF|nr:hypothetical protein ZIOFF_057594 [Zingiber officinale]